MNKFIKKFLVLSFSIFLLIPNSTANAAELTTFDVNEIDVSVDQLSDGDGITVYVTFDQKGNITSKEVFTGDISIPQTKNSGDGVLEWAIFHLDFKDWTTDNGDLYYTATCDEETVKVGFKNVVIITVSDEYDYIPNASALVDR